MMLDLNAFDLLNEVSGSMVVYLIGHLRPGTLYILAPIRFASLGTVAVLTIQTCVTKVLVMHGVDITYEILRVGCLSDFAVHGSLHFDKR